MPRDLASHMDNRFHIDAPGQTDLSVAVGNELMVEAFRLFFRTGPEKITELFEQVLTFLGTHLEAQASWFILWPGSRESQGHFSEWRRESGFHSQQSTVATLQQMITRAGAVPCSVSASILRERSLVAFIGVEGIAEPFSMLVQRTTWLQSLGEIFWAAFERHRHLQTIESEKQTLTRTLLGLADGVISISTSGCITLMNAAAGEILEVSPAEASQKPLAAVLRMQDPSDTQRLETFLQQLPLGGPHDLPATLMHIELPSKLRKIISLRGSPLQSPEPSLRGGVLMFRDCTEQIRLDAQHALSQKMESIGRLAAGIAHEINTPMQFIGDNRRFLADALQGFSTVLKKYKSEFEQLTQGKDVQEVKQEISRTEQEADLVFLEEEIPQALAQMEEGVKRVSSIIAAVKNFSHPSQGSRTLSDINRGIEDTIMISRNEWKYHAELITALSPTLPLIPCFLDEFNQVILNMIINAVHAIEGCIQQGRYKRGKILISTGVRENHAMVTIRDDGGGIPTELLPRIFDPFFTTKPIGKGTGQGLAIAHDIIVQRHQGRIEVESEPGKGTTFKLLLPLKDPEADRLPESLPRSPS